MRCSAAVANRSRTPRCGSMSPSRCAAGCADPAGQSDRADGGSAPLGSPILAAGSGRSPPRPPSAKRELHVAGDAVPRPDHQAAAAEGRHPSTGERDQRQHPRSRDAAVSCRGGCWRCPGAAPHRQRTPRCGRANVRGNLQHRGCRRPGRVPRFRRLRGGDVRGAARSGVSTDPTSGRSGATTIPLSPTPLVIAEGRGPMTTLRAERVRSGTMMSIRDVRLFVQVVGDGYPLVLMHGGPGADHWTMLPFRRRGPVHPGPLRPSPQRTLGGAPARP